MSQASCVIADMLPRESNSPTRKALAMSDIRAASRPRVKRKNIFVRILEALHVSRRLEAQHVLRRYGHLIDRHHSIVAVGIVPDASHMEESHRNAHGKCVGIVPDASHMEESHRNAHG